MLTTLSNVLPLHLKQTFSPIIWIFIEASESEGDGINLSDQIQTIFLNLFYFKLIHKEESKSIACSRCDKSFRHLSTYRKHIARVHDFLPEQRLKCEGCAKLFNHMEGLKRHMKKFHSGEKPQYQCDLCPMAFVFNYDLNKHKKRVHFVAIKWFCAEAKAEMWRLC